MNYVLWIYFPALAAGAWLYMFTLGGPDARAVLTLGVIAARPAPATRPARLPDTPHKRNHRTFPVVAPAAPPAPVRGVAQVPTPPTLPHVEVRDPAMLPGDVLLVQHAAPLIGEQPDQLDAGPAQGWDGFEDRLLATLSARDGAIRLEGWHTGEWRVAA